MLEIVKEPTRPLRKKAGFSLPQRINAEFDSIGFHGGSWGGVYHRVVFFNLISNVIDFFVLSSLSFFLLAFLGYFKMIGHGFLNFSWPTAVSFMISFKLAQTFIRICFGRSVGDWACGLRILVFTKAKRKARVQRTLRILTRALLNLTTGIVVLPLLSALFKKDIAGEISKAYLFKFSASTLK